MTIVVNGDPRTVADNTTVSDLLEELKLGQAVCAVEVNRTLISKPKHAAQTLAEGDQIEIVTLVGGG